MKCPRCTEIVPADVVGARFCVDCGGPVAQKCPYEGDEADGLIALRDLNDEGPAMCPECSGLLRTCSRCGRLHRVQEQVCATSGCAAPLEEPPGASPCSYGGSADGRRVVRWLGDLDLRPDDPSVLQLTALSAMAYRYGLLVVVSGATVEAYRWKATAWDRVGRAALPGVGPHNVRTLVLEWGRVHIVLQDKVVVYDFHGDFALLERLPGRYGAQCHGNQWWALAVHEEDLPGKIVLQNLGSGARTMVNLPCPGPAVTGIAWNGEFVIGTRTHGVLLLAPETEEVKSVLDTSGMAITQVACIGDRIVALGRDENMTARLLSLDRVGQVVSKCDIAEQVGNEFALTDAAVVVPAERQLVIRTHSQLGLQPSPVGIGGTLVGGTVILHGSRSDHALAALRRDNTFFLAAVDLETRRQVSVGGAYVGQPRFCAAGDRLVVAVEERTGVVLRTFVFREGK